MRQIVLLVCVLYLFQFTTAYSCFRDPWMLPSSCACSTTNTCPTANPCGCNIPCKCFRDPANVCDTCDPPSPVCQCLAQCDCDCGCKAPIYFPEVEYPVTIMEMSPFFYGSCWSY